MSVFADSSALVKLYADESGFEAVRETPFFACSALARVEVPSAIWRKARIGDLSARQAAVLTTEFEGDYARTTDCTHPLFGIEAAGPVLDRAATFTAEHALRAYDAVQLASATSARAVDPRCDSFACFDEVLREAAATQGFKLMP